MISGRYDGIKDSSLLQNSLYVLPSRVLEGFDVHTESFAIDISSTSGLMNTLLLVPCW